MTTASTWNPIENKSFDELSEEIHRPLLRRQLASVAARSPFYKAKFDSTASIDSADLCLLPFTTKREFLEDERTFPPFGSLLATSRDVVQRIHRTSGSTGQPLMLALSSSDLENTLECGARCFLAAGVRASDTIVHCLNYCMWAGGATDQQSLERTGAAVVPFGVGNSEELLRVIRLTGATGIHCTPSYLAKLEALMTREAFGSPRALMLKLGLFGGEAGLQDPRFRSRIETTWGFRAVDANYGLADVLSMFGSECEVRQGLHFMGQGVVHPEIVSVSGNECIAWEPGAQGELVLTHLVKECQPLVRFRTGDHIQVVSVDKCDCGRRSPRFKVIGRIDALLVIRGINVFPSSIAGIVNGHLDKLSGEYNILVSRYDPIERIILRLEVRPGSEALIGEATLTEALVEECRRTLSIRPEIELLAPNSLPKSTDKTRRTQRVL